jgi:hypothetical protein
VTSWSRCAIYVCCTVAFDNEKSYLPLKPSRSLMARISILWIGRRKWQHRCRAVSCGMNEEEVTQVTSRVGAILYECID